MNDRLDVDGPAAPPRANGELLFEEPWQSRLFGLTLALCEGGAFAWDDFRDELIAAIARAERALAPDEPYRYYECWLAALERLLVAREICDGGVLEALRSELAARPHGHDH